MNGSYIFHLVLMLFSTNPILLEVSWSLDIASSEREVFEIIRLLTILITFVGFNFFRAKIKHIPIRDVNGSPILLLSGGSDSLKTGFGSLFRL